MELWNGQKWGPHSSFFQINKSLSLLYICGYIWIILNHTIILFRNSRNSQWASPRVWNSCCGSLTSWLLCSCRFRSFLKPLKRPLGNVVIRLPPRFSFNKLRLRLWSSNTSASRLASWFCCRFNSSKQLNPRKSPEWSLWSLLPSNFRLRIERLQQKNNAGSVDSSFSARSRISNLLKPLWKTFGGNAGNACNLLCETSKLVRFSRSNSLESHFLRLLWLKSITDKFNLSKRPGGNSSNAFWLRFSNFKELKFLRLWMQVGNPINGFGSHMAPLPTIRQWEGAHHKPGNLWFSKGPCELFRWE